MISIVLTNRDRNLTIVVKSLKSLSLQSDKEFIVFLVDYGSKPDYIQNLKEVLKEFTFVELIICPVYGQLWNKSRAINIALKKCQTTYFLVGDIDLIFHPDFIKKGKKMANSKEVHYFQYGFLSPEESLKEQNFDAYKVDFKGNDEVTGTTLFPTEVLMSVNGYDEFYHGWGAEDTDIHIRIKNAGLSVIFQDSEILVKHQWHPKAYRSKNSSNPFHSALERINHSYMNLTEQSKRSKVNIHNKWGEISLEVDYQELLNNEPDHKFILDTEDIKLSAVLMQFGNFENEIIEIIIKKVFLKERFKQIVKRLLGKKNKTYLDLQVVNNRILEKIVSSHRNNLYQYFLERKKGIIRFKIKF